MDSSTKRIFVGGLYNNITESELSERFSKFGNVDNIEIKTKKNSDGFSVLNRSRWKGKELKIQHAKADFMKRLKEERENNFEKAEKPKTKKVVYQDPLEGVAGVDNFHMKGAVPGTPVDVEEKNWVVGKYGRVLPIVNIRRRDKRKFMTVDPSKFCHNSKRIKEDDMENSDTGVQNLTWKIDTKDSEVIKRRKGEFPAWKQKKKKQTADADMKLLANYYESFTKTNAENTSNNTDFEVVPKSFLKVPQKSSYFSEDSDSNEDSTENCKTSTPFPSPLPKLQQKATVKTGKDHSVKQRNDSTGKQTMLPDPKCTPIMKPLGKGQKDIGDKPVGNEDNSKSLSPCKKTVTLKNTSVKSVTSNISSASSSQKTVSRKSVPDQNSTSTSKMSKVLAEVEEQLHDQSLKPKGGQVEKTDFSNPSVNKSSNKRTDSFTEGKKSLTKKPKLQAFGGTRNLYDNPSSESQQKVESAAPTSTASPSSVSAPAEPHKEAMLGVKRTLFQTSMLKTAPEKEKEVQEDSDGESVSSTDTDVIIASAKKQRGGGTVMGYGSLETPVSLQASLADSVYSEFGGGLVDGEVSGQASWMEVHDNYEANDSDDSDDFEKLAVKILKKTQQTNLLASNKGFENKDGKTKEKIVQNSEIENSKDSDSDTESDDENTDTSDSGDDDESSSSVDDVDDTDQEEEEDSDEEDSTSSDEEDTGVNKGVLKNTEISKEVKIRKGKQDQQEDSHAAGEDKDKRGAQERTENSASDTKENKGKTQDKVDQKRLAIEANRKKQESLRLKQVEYNARRSIIKRALSATDNTKRSNRIVFDSDGDDDTAQKPVTKTTASQQPDKKPWDLEDSDEGDDSEDDSSEEEESDEESDEKLQSVGASAAEKKEKMSLFEESSSEDDDSDEDAFENKPQFEGEVGSKLMKLQMKFSSDTRFKIDKRFVESDEEQDDGEGSNEEVEDEKMRNLKVLQEVVGVQVAVVTDKKDRLKKQFKDISALQYDPSREDHKNFEIQPTTDAGQKKNIVDKKNKSKKQKAEEGAETEEAEPLPVVSGEKFYEVSSALDNAFKTSDDNDSKTETGEFSLLAAFGRKVEDHDDAEEIHDEPTAPTNKWKGLNVQNSSDEEDLSDGSDEEKDTEGGGEGSKQEEKSVSVTKNKNDFFFTEDDERIKEGIASFCRQEDIEEIREHWQERRPDLIKAYHAKHKRAVRNKRALEKKKMTAKRQ
ncbi:nucleolar protein 8-like isoform X2 [Mizuhopecten yessoensis]|uniref:nucleolar protein 8-like isoform X2 n=1 Tax=Mizuhopecten yessoensis TaxID=6573 RepID=UPI000B45C214|nr:nucleolar protein 8-like isoform X2 [Mizuhopecten yessoensis]